MQQQQQAEMGNKMVDAAAGPVAQGMVDGIRNGDIDMQSVEKQLNNYTENN